jgi:hypothetical protein
MRKVALLARIPSTSKGTGQGYFRWVGVRTNKAGEPRFEERFGKAQSFRLRFTDETAPTATAFSITFNCGVAIESLHTLRQSANQLLRTGSEDLPPRDEEIQDHKDDGQ